MPDSMPELTFTPRASGDGTWYVEVASPGLACEDIGDFRSKESAEAWIRNSSPSYAAGGESVPAACTVGASTFDGAAF
jgi:hypothetical protein